MLPPVVEPVREVRVRSRRVDVDPTAIMLHIQGRDASNTAGESRPQTHTILCGVKEEAKTENDFDEDIDMGEGEVEEMRERLTCTRDRRGRGRGRGFRDGGLVLVCRGG